MSAGFPAEARQIEVVAGVIELEAFRDWADEQLVCDDVRAAAAKGTVAVTVPACEPRPAFVRPANIDLAPEAFRQRWPRIVG